MLERVVLDHCEPVQVYQSETAGLVCVLLAVGGASGDGAVHVVPNQGARPAIGVVLPDSTDSVAFNDCTSVTLHYVRSRTGPDSVPATYTVS